MPDAERTYARFAPRYTEIEAEINSLWMQNEAQKKSGDILLMIDILDKQFGEYKAAHWQKGVLSRGEAETFNDYMQSYWKTLLRTERNLTRKSYPMPVGNNEFIIISLWRINEHNSLCLNVKQCKFSI